MLGQQTPGRLDLALILLFLQIPISILANIVANYVQQTFEERPRFERLPTRNKLVLFLVIFVLLQIPAVILVATLSSAPVTAASESISCVASWIASLAFAVLVVYLDGYYWNTEIQGGQPSDHAKHFIMGFIFNLACAPLILPILLTMLKVKDPRLLLFYHSLTPTFVLTFPAFVVSVYRYTQQVAIERSPEAVQRQLAGFRQDVEALASHGDTLNSSVQG